jgi:sorbitol/mannitol transport system substrate-binding protein
MRGWLRDIPSGGPPRSLLGWKRPSPVACLSNPGPESEVRMGFLSGNGSLSSRAAIFWRRAGSLVVGFVLFAGGVLAHGSEVVRLAAVEMAPYLGANIERQGYAAEVARLALERAGYKVDIRFYPPARAFSLTESGSVDGMLPIAGDRPAGGAVVLSRPFPGLNLGLLKRRAAHISYPEDARRSPEDVLRTMTGYRIGVPRGQMIPAVFDAVGSLQLEYVGNDLQNLDKLALGRIDLMLVDKYRASDLMVLHRPHLIGQFEFLNPALFSTPFHLAWSLRSPRHAELAAAFDGALQKMMADGELDEILFSHGLRGDRPRNGAGVRLTIATVNNPDMLVMRRLSAEFERDNPDIALDWRVIDETVLRTRLMTDLAIADGQFDVMTIGSYETPIWGARGWLEPIRGLPAAYGVDDLLPSVRASLTHDGELYALPFYAESSMTYYRRDLFEQAGVKMPVRPTYDDIERLAGVLHDPTGGVSGICLRGKVGWGENVAVIAPMVNTFGGRWFDEQWLPEVESPAWRAALERYVRLLTRYGPADAATRGYRDMLQLFADGGCAIWIDATVAAGYLFNPRQSAVAGKVGYAPAPVGRVEVGANWLWSWALAIPASSTHKAQARRFLEWATSREYIARVGKLEGPMAVPPGTRASTYAGAEYLAVAPFARFVLSSVRDADVALPGRQYKGIQYVSIPEFPAVGQALSVEANRALIGRVPVERALRNARAEIHEIMKSAGYYDAPAPGR